MRAARASAYHWAIGRSIAMPAAPWICTARSTTRPNASETNVLVIATSWRCGRPCSTFQAVCRTISRLA
jgi:hypothetical protein